MIPLAKDTCEAIGAFASRIENRSLLFEKMVLAKGWGHEARFDDAQRFNVLRATHEGNKVLSEEKKTSDKKANSPRAEEHAKQQARYKSKVASELCSIYVVNDALAESRIRSTLRLQTDLARTYQDRCVTFPAQLGGRLLINMAGGVMENSGLALDRITGLPLIPGTAVKGITRHAALWEIRNNQHDQPRQTLLLRQALAIFGFCSNDISGKGDFLWAVHEDKARLAAALDGFKTDTYKGVLCFLTAHPSNSSNLRIVAEVLTPHFNNNLRPIFFPAVETGAEFAFAIIGQRTPHLPDLTRVTLLAQAKQWLQAALQENGIGAKTGAGYGWFTIDPQAEEKQQQALRAEQELQSRLQAEAEEKARAEAEQQKLAQAEQERLANLTDRDRFAEQIAALDDLPFSELAKDLANKSAEEQLAFFDVFLSSDKKERRKQWKKKKADLWASLVEIAKQHNLELN